MLLLQFQASPRPGWSKLCRFYLSWKRAMAETAGQTTSRGQETEFGRETGTREGKRGREGKRRRS